LILVFVFVCREAALATPIPETNVGHKMLAKLGWQTGQSIGNPERQGIIEPLEPIIRSKGRGLAEASRSSSRKRSKLELDESRVSTTTAAEHREQQTRFRARVGNQFEQKHLQQLLNQALEACV
jgi:hypothetical protein